MFKKTIVAALFVISGANAQIKQATSDVLKAKDFVAHSKPVDYATGDILKVKAGHYLTSDAVQQAESVFTLKDKFLVNQKTFYCASGKASLDYQIKVPNFQNTHKYEGTAHKVCERVWNEQAVADMKQLIDQNFVQTFSLDQMPAALDTTGALVGESNGGEGKLVTKIPIGYKDKTDYFIYNRLDMTVQLA